MPRAALVKSQLRSTELNREVALKELQERLANLPDSRARFVLEAEITGGLEHPGVVPVYGLGAYADGRSYYAMRFINGVSLKQGISEFHAGQAGRSARQQGLEFRRLLQRFIGVCQAIEYAHSRGVLHRDLKPGNVMLGKYGETLVVDWGLAKAQGRADYYAIATGEATLRPDAANAATPTVMGSTLGTPAFMSPEQAAGRLDLLGPASDVYSLGATLYALLTGQAPIEGREAELILSQVRAGQFKNPRAVRPEVPAALEAVCLKAMALRPVERYRSARELADEIERWLADEPVAARKESLAERSRRFARRHRSWVAAGAAALALVAVVATGSALLVNSARREESRQRSLALLEKADAVRNEERAKQAEEEARRQAARLERQQIEQIVAFARRAEDEGDFGGALVALARASSFSAGDPELDPLNRRRFLSKLRHYPLEGAWINVRSAEFSPNGAYVVTAGRDGAVEVHATAAGHAPGALMRHQGEVMHASFDLAGQRVVSAGLDNQAVVWDAKSGAKLATMMHAARVIRAWFDSTGRFLITISADQRLQAHELKTAATTVLADDVGLFLDITADRRLLAYASAAGTGVIVRELPLGKPLLAPISAAQPMLAGARFSPNGRLLAIASNDLDEFDVEMVEPRVVIPSPITRSPSSGQGEPATAPAPQPERVDEPARPARLVPPHAPVVEVESRIFAAAAIGKRQRRVFRKCDVRVCDLESGEFLGAPMRHTLPIKQLSFCPDGTFLSTVSPMGSRVELRSSAPSRSAMR
jgi:hypothetical protein